MTNQKERQSNFELLRIIAMLLVICLHYLSKGNVMQKLSVDLGVNNLVFNLINDFAAVAVNIYVLISGYFLVESKWHVSKIVKLVCQVLFYSVIVSLIFAALSHIPVFSGYIISLDSVDKWSLILPIQYENYWFATAYVGMYIFAPLLALGIKQLSQKQLKWIILVALCYFSLFKSIVPNRIPIDDYGYDFGWFMVLFMIAAYIRLYGIKLLDNKKKCFAIYIVTVLVTFIIQIFFGYMEMSKGILEYSMDMTGAYNHILVLIASVALFGAFIGVDVKSDAFAKNVCRIAPLTFGVYLFHENVMIRLTWPYMLGVDKINGLALQLLHMVMSIVVVFIVGSLVDYVRKVIFDAVEKVFTNAGKNKKVAGD